MPAAAPEPEYDLPSCYKHTPQRLQPGYLTKFKEETLFYIFYRCEHARVGVDACSMQLLPGLHSIARCCFPCTRRSHPCSPLPPQHAG